MKNQNGPLIENQSLTDRVDSAIKVIRSLGRDQVADSFQNTEKAIVSSKNLSSQQKQTHINSLASIAEEVTRKKPRPNIIREIKETFRQPPKTDADKDPVNEAIETLFKLPLAFM